MKLSLGALGAVTFLSSDACGFFVPQVSTFGTAGSKLPLRMEVGEFDHFLGEGKFPLAGHDRNGSRKSVVRVPDGSSTISLTSSIAADASAVATDELFESIEGEQTFDDTLSDPRVEELVKQKEQRLVEGFKFEPMKFIEGKDVTDLFFTVLLPVGFGLYGARWAYGKGTGYLAETAEGKIFDYANEMVYHDGDFEEMQMCHSEYSKTLAWLGPNKKDRMIKTYLEAFAKKISVSPKSISSLSYAFSLYKLSEDKAAKILAETCTAMPEKAASNQKLLFFGDHILKSAEARAKLQPIRDMLTESYRDDGIDGDLILEKSQKAMGEAAYTTAITSAGKKQSKLTPGWEVLGLDKETATRIFDKERETGFISSKEAKYGRASAKYDKLGRRIDKDGEIVDDNGVEDDGSDDGPVSNVQECSKCGFTLFVAEGRSHKFFGSGFTCPECGATKEKFVGRNAGED